MQIKGFQLVVTIALAAVGAVNASAAGFVLVIRNGAAWQVQAADKVTINGKNKLRVVSSTGTAPISQDEYKRLGEEVLGSRAIRVHRGGYFVIRNGDSWKPVLPDGAGIKGSAAAQALWSSAQIVLGKKGVKDQGVAEGSLFAILPGVGATPADTAVTFLSDEANFHGVGEATPADSFDERMSMLVGLAATATGDAKTKLHQTLADSMSSALKRANTGGRGRVSGLNEGLRFVPVAASAFPGDPQISSLSADLQSKNKALNQRVAIVKALGVAAEWDALVEKYADGALNMEDYDDAYADLHQLRDRSYKESETLHSARAHQYFEAKQCPQAAAEIELAEKVDTTNPELKSYADQIRLGCIDGGTKPPPPTGPTETTAQKLSVQSHVKTAELDMGDGNFNGAEQEIEAAVKVFPEDDRIVFTRAELLHSRRKLKEAITMLNSYDKRVSGDPDETKMAKSTDLRAVVQHEMNKDLETARQTAVKDETDGDYPGALKAVLDGLAIDSNDAELLYHAGLDSAIVRDEKGARQYWQSYLNVSTSLTGESDRRTKVRNLSGDLSFAAVPSGGAGNWFSGRGGSADLAYDPASLTLNYRPFEIKSSNKQSTTFVWKGSTLASVHTVTLTPGDVPVDVYFDYYPGGKQVRRVSTTALEDKDAGVVKLTTDGAAGPGKGSYVALYTDPAVNPFMIEKLTGKRVATIVAGNPYFNPFVWTGVYSFLAEYDSEGRVKSATPIKSRNTKPLDFQWEANKLMSISERGGEYRREMKYEGNRLAGELIHYGGKTIKINYSYKSGSLMSADSDNDTSLDGRSRKVTFAN